MILRNICLDCEFRKSQSGILALPLLAAWPWWLYLTSLNLGFFTFHLHVHGLELLKCIEPKWRRKWQPTPVLLPGKFHGWGSLVGYSPWGCKELDATERLHFLSFCSSFWRRKWQPTPVFLPGESHGQRGLVGLFCGVAKSQTQLSKTHTHTQPKIWSTLSLSKWLSSVLCVCVYVCAELKWMLRETENDVVWSVVLC